MKVKNMKNGRRFWYVTLVLVLALGLLAACGGNEDNTTGLNGDEDFGNVDATLTVDETTGLQPTPLAPELSVTIAVTDDVQTTPDVDATATVEPTVAATPTLQVQATAEVTGTGDITGTDEITGTGVMTSTAGAAGSFLVRASTLLGMELSDEVDETAGELQDILFAEDGTLHYAILDLDGDDGTETVAVPWDQLNLQAVSGMETDDPDYGLTWADGRDAAMVITLESDVLGDDSAIVDAAGLGLSSDTASLMRMSATVDEDLLDDEVADDNLDDLLGAGNEEIGDIEDLLVDADAGQVIYALVEVEDDILQVDDALVAIPWHRLTLSPDQDGFTADVELTVLAESPVLDLDAAFAASQIRLDDAVRSGLDTYWDVDIDLNG